ncbi:MAG: hypothetical protein WDM85_12440 [Caulobacteraceae bacterium]
MPQRRRALLEAEHHHRKVVFQRAWPGRRANRVEEPARPPLAVSGAVADDLAQVLEVSLPAGFVEDLETRRR